MKLFAFVDLHGNMRLLKEIVERVNRNRYDAVVMAGDISVFEQNMARLMAELAKIKVPILALHGNHEAAATMRNYCSRYEHLHFLHKKVLNVRGIRFAGYGGGGFAIMDSEFEDFAQKLENVDVLITHAPPYNTALDALADAHVGSKSIRDFITTKKPRLCIAGHLHENAGKTDERYGCKIINPGPTGRVIIL